MKVKLLDPSVILAAALDRDSPESALVEAALSRRCAIVVSGALLTNYREALGGVPGLVAWSVWVERLGVVGVRLDFPEKAGESPAWVLARETGAIWVGGSDPAPGMAAQYGVALMSAKDALGLLPKV